MSAANRLSRRVLVTLDADPDSLDLLERAADLAQAIDAELAGLFVEDENLLRLSELPGTEFVFSTGGSRRTSLTEMERQLRARAAEAERRLQRIATRREVAWSFQVRRCAWSQAVSEATQDALVVATGRSGRAPAHGYGLAPEDKSPRRVTAGGLAVLYEGDQAARAVLDLGRRAAAALDTPLTVLIPARTTAIAERRAAEVREQCAALRPAPAVIRLPATRAALLRRLREKRPEVLLLDAGGTLASSGRLRDLVDAADCRVMLVARE